MEAIQVCRFSNGGFVLHKITGAFTGRCSAWFDADGTMTACEQIIGYGRGERSVRVDGPIWNHCRTMGARYVHARTVGGLDTIRRMPSDAHLDGCGALSGPSRAADAQAATHS